MVGSDFTGYGEQTYASGNKYEGEWKDGKREGRGTMTWDNGQKYIGEWRNGKPEGHGTLTLADGTKYVGEWRNGVEEGTGTHTSPDGEKYVGEYRNGVQEGHGTHMWPDGSTYTGGYKNNVQHGSALYRDKNGQLFQQEWENGQRTKHKLLSLATSNFLVAYKKAKPPDTMMILGSKLGAVIRHHCDKHDIPYDDDEGEEFFRQLQQDMDDDNDSTVEAVQRMWTSYRDLRGKEFCAILNGAVRDDHKDHVAPVAALTRAINKLCVKEGRMPQPPFPDGDVCYRGGGFNDSYRDFFVPGHEFRQPAFLATSFLESTADNFMYRSTMPAKVKWLIHLDPLRKCIHVNLVRRRVPNLPDEKEYLFAPYSVFTVRSAQWNNGTNADPHIIELEAAHDNKEHSEELPLAPWS
eukprot:CAMPEP_0197441764 /NCGR_PEP_ID=MMETSP1175-20131217/7953_1 /TAXON_ID=1003142 /ORGANISM="Triceratium dubium, Strain CCMP147" /LENGTH=407 /DNA_ID=CAMNT_0042972095 /DNA_START=498 /DNA_END=1721 /DNA_ORIENTATION=+